jgi:hypothetical protein
MSNISSNSLFHFTTKIDYLLNILENGFSPRYCLESATLSTEMEREGIGQITPMVCFCDISLSQISKHIDRYGKYGIGMTKEWGIKNRLNPVIYVNTNSKLSNSFIKLTNSIVELLGEHCTENTKDASDELMNLLKFIKPYQGFDETSNEHNIKFYDEKEWRYVPEISFDTQIDNSLSILEYYDSATLQKANEKLKDYKLTFTPADIRYIFIPSQKEIHFIITLLKKTKIFSAEEIEIITTKILTIEQIMDDF